MENKAVIIDLKNISISFDDQPILKDVSLEIHDGEFVTLLGPSGCGKTTTLRIIAGFLSPDSGDVIFEGKKINGVPAHKRQVNTIFQRYALFPNLNVADNIAFGLKLQKKSKSEIKKIVEEMLSLVNLKGFENAMFHLFPEVSSSASQLRAPLPLNRAYCFSTNRSEHLT